MSLAPIAFVVQRYGAEITGGAEQHCRAAARRLAEHYDVTVLTTCALDHTTWANHYAPGESLLDGVRLLRFPVDKGRAADFNSFNDVFHTGRRSRAEELAWLEKQGPNCPALLEHLRNEGTRYSAVIFYTYLYSPTVLGLPLVADRALLVSTAHDEPAIRMGIFRELFRLPRHIIFLTSTEENLVRRLSGNEHIPGTVVGTGMDLPADEPSPPRFLERFQVRDKFIIYAGRVEAGKGCGEMVDFFCRYKSQRPDGPTLVLLGRVDMPLPKRPDVRALGFVSEEDKWDAISAASLLLAPSPYESLSIAILEAWSLATPVLANGRCAVLAEQCLAGNGGLFYTNYAEFEACLDFLLADSQTRETLGRQGTTYVKSNYTWQQVVPRWQAAIDSVINPHPST